MIKQAPSPQGMPRIYDSATAPAVMEETVAGGRIKTAGVD
ncbi:Hypothetical protein ETEE_3616 [Edwardsiella anguillarum ET080813]|uniref:Uncharacterized protein n=1 Tax=Edwardsiella anguillarum ET080813 TaxID=667120 RepID=A0A076LQ18_9GAMM|nr:Hypothetical protein ETEE_3616 [Edwardsiella anguillarum ET080813]